MSAVDPWFLCENGINSLCIKRFECTQTFLMLRATVTNTVTIFNCPVCSRVNLIHTHSNGQRKVCLKILERSTVSNLKYLNIESN